MKTKTLKPAEMLIRGNGHRDIRNSTYLKPQTKERQKKREREKNNTDNKKQKNVKKKESKKLTIRAESRGNRNKK